MLKRIRDWIAAALGFERKPDFTVELVGTNPSRGSVPSGRIIVVGGPGYQKWAYLRCPCGCGEVIMLSLNHARRPRWSVTIDARGRPTIYPSVRQIAGCFSHFWIRGGRVEWCADTGAGAKRLRRAS